MTTFRHCPKCIRGLVGIEGHDRIAFAGYQPNAGGVLAAAFECALCGTRWQRRYLGEGTFEWAREPEAPPIARHGT
jgi:hypothetical protein